MGDVLARLRELAKSGDVRARARVNVLGRVEPARGRVGSDRADESAVPAALSDLIGYLMRRASSTVHQLASVAFAPLGLSPQAYGILCLLADEGPLTQQRVGERMHIDRSTMVALVDDLELIRAVRRRVHPADRRAHWLEVTPGGRTLLTRASRVADLTHEEFFAPLDVEERTTLVRVLTKLVNHHHGLSGGQARTRGAREGVRVDDADRDGERSARGFARIVRAKSR